MDEEALPRLQPSPLEDVGPDGEEVSQSAAASAMPSPSGTGSAWSAGVTTYSA
jgi:hypothetical protein